MTTRAALGDWLHRVTVWHDVYRFTIDAIGLLLLAGMTLSQWDILARAAATGGLPLQIGAGGVALAIGVAATHIRIPAGNGVVFTPSVAALFVILFLLGPWWAALGLLLGNLLRRRYWRISLFYGMQWVVAIGGADAVYRALGGHYGLAGSLATPLANVAAIVTIFILNSVLVYWSFHQYNLMAWRDIAGYFRGDTIVYGASAFVAFAATYCLYLLRAQGLQALPVLGIIAVLAAGLAILVNDNLQLRSQTEQFAALTDLAGKLIWSPGGGEGALGSGAGGQLIVPDKLAPEVRAQLLVILESLRALNDFIRATIWIGSRPDATLRQLICYTVEPGDRWTLVPIDDWLPRPLQPTNVWPGLYASTIYGGWDRRELATGYAEIGTTTDTASVLATPLIIGDRLIGMLALESFRHYHAQGASERQTDLISGHLALFLARSSLAAEQQRLAAGLATLQARTRAENQRLASEMQTAGRMQARLLPAEPPIVPGLVLAAYSQPAMEVGGDFYDYQVLDDGRLGLLIGDATGKGTAAVMQTAMVKSLLSGFWERADGPGHVLQRLNEILYEILPHNGMTCFCLLIDRTRGTLTYANAGHLYPYRIHAGTVAYLEGGALPLGMIPQLAYPEYSAPFTAGDTLVLYTDGVVECQDKTGALFGFERLEAILQGPAASPARLQRRVLDAVAAFAAHKTLADDLSLIIVQRDESSVGSRQSPVDIIPAADDRRLTTNDRRLTTDD